MPDNSFKYYNTAWRTIKTPKYYDGVAWRTANTIKYYDGASWRIIYLGVGSVTISAQPTTFATAVSISSQPSAQTFTPSAPSISVQPTAQTANAGTPTVSSQPSNQTSNAGTPTIGTQPTSQTSNAGTPTVGTSPSSSTVTAPATSNFSVSATSPDGGSLSYQWQRSTDGGTNFSNVNTGSGGTSASYTTEATTTGMSNYRYRCVVTNTKSNTNTFSISATSPDSGSISYLWYLGGVSTGNTTTSYATSSAGTVYCAVTNTKTNTVTFSLSATSPDSGTLSYQWKTSGGSNVGTNSTSFTTSTAGSYYCQVTNTKTNNNTFSVTASAGGTLSYQWKLNGSNVGTNSNSYVTSSAGTVYCALTNTQTGNVTFNITASSSTSGTLSYQWYNGGAGAGTNSSSYTTSTAGTVYCAVTATNSSNTFSVTASGNGTITYQWYVSGVASGTSSTQSVSTGGGANVYCAVTNTRNGVGSTTNSSTVTNTLSATSNSSSVAATTSGTASVNSSSVASTINTTATANSSTVSATINTTTTSNSTSVSSTVNTTATATSSSATLTVNAAQTNVRPNTFTTDANLSWYDSGNTTDGSYDDTSTFGFPTQIGYNIGVNQFGYIQFASQAYSTATLYLKYGWDTYYDSYTGDASTTLSIMQTSNSDNLSTIATKSYSDASSSSAQTATFSLAASNNLNYIKVKVGFRRAYSEETDYNNCTIYGNYDPETDSYICTQYGTISHESIVGFTIYDCYIIYTP